MDERNDLYANVANEEQTIDIADVMAVSSGIMEDGLPKSSIVISLLREDENGQIDDSMTADFGAPVNFLVSYANSLVIESVFDINIDESLNEIVPIMQEWLRNIRDQQFRNTHELHVIVTPLPLRGNLIIDLLDLMYVALYRTDDNWHLIMVFSIDDTDRSIDFLVGEEMNIEDIKTQVEAEINREIDRLDDEYAMYEEELEELENQNSYAKFIEENFSIESTGILDVGSDEEEDEEDLGGEDEREFKFANVYGDDEDDDAEDDDDEDDGEDDRRKRRSSWMRMSDS